MGIWNFKKNQKKDTLSSESNETKMEQSAKKGFTEEELLDKRIDESISRVLASAEDPNNFFVNEGKKILLSKKDYRPLFRKCVAVYSKKWKSVAEEELSLPELDTIIRKGIEAFCKMTYLEKINDLTYFLESDAKGGTPYTHEGKENMCIFLFFPEPYAAYDAKKKEQEIQQLNKQIEKLKEIVNKPIRYGDSGRISDKIDFDEEFNVFAEKLREQKMDEISIFKLVSRMGELKKQYELVIKHPDRDLLERLEAQVLLEFYEQIKEQEERQSEEAEGQAGGTRAVLENAGGVADSIKQIENGVSTLTWLKIIDGFFGH